jgi:hypothetical protein
MLQHPQVSFLGFLGREWEWLSKVGEQVVRRVLECLQDRQALRASFNVRANPLQSRLGYATDAEGFQLVNTRAGLLAMASVHDLTSDFVITAASGVATFPQAL